MILLLKFLEPSTEAMTMLELKLEKIRMPSASRSEFRLSSDVNCKLPKFELPVFSGDPIVWQGFWD